MIKNLKNKIAIGVGILGISSALIRSVVLLEKRPTIECIVLDDTYIPPSGGILGRLNPGYRFGEHILIVNCNGEKRKYIFQDYLVEMERVYKQSSSIKIYTDLPYKNINY